LTADAVKADFYETVAKGRDAKIASNWVMGELFGALNKASVELENSPVSADALGGLLDRIADKTISGKIAKEVFERVIAANPDQAAKAKENPKLVGFFVGQVMKASQGKANPQAVNQILRQKLGL